jgi:hypothetical protein
MEGAMPLHPDEPEFRIRAQDALAPNAVEAWAAFAELAAKATGVEHLFDQAAQAASSPATCVCGRPSTRSW